MLRKFSAQDGTLVEADRPDNNIWVYVTPIEEEKQYITKELQIDESDLHYALDPEEVPRLMVEENYTTLIWKQPRTALFSQHSLFNVGSVGIFIKPDKVIFVLDEDSVLFDRKYQPKVYFPFDVILNFLYHSIHHFLGHLRVIKQISTELQNKINTAMENQYLIQMFNLSESLIYYLDAISANNSVLVKLHNYAFKNKELKSKAEFLDDIMVENSQCYKQAEIYSQILSGLMDARGTLVNNNMNILIKNLTTINVIFLPLNLIASIGGMSEYSMMTKNIDWKIAYFIFLIVMVITGWITAIVLSRLSVPGRYSKRAKARSH